jgi:hypothetical protein
MSEQQDQLIADAIAAVAGVCDARQIPDSDWNAYAEVIRSLGLFTGAGTVEVRGALRLGEEAHVSGSYVIFTATPDAAGQIGTSEDTTPPDHLRHLVRTDLGADMGRVFMRRESLGDKISESYNQIEVDFEAHPQFSDRYYVLAEDEDRFRANITAALLDAIGSIEGLLVEIDDSTMTATFERPVTPRDAVALARLAIVAAVR